jgi:cytochrome P450
MTESVAKDWLRQGRVAFKPAARRLFAGIASRIFLGIDDPEEAKMLDVALADAWKGLIAIAKNPLLSPTWRRALRGHRTLREALERRVDERRTGTGSDLFSQLCRAGQEAAWRDNGAIARLFIGILFAAFDTTSLGAASMAYLLARNPDWQEKLREESRRVAPGSLTMESMKHLVLHDWVWKESLRLFPIANGLPRRPLQDVHVGPHRIPAGALVYGLIGPLLQDRRWWTNPEQFDPERFSPERAEDKGHRAAYLPFGSGAHVCIGQQLAGIEIKAFWHALLGRSRIRLARDYRARHVYAPLGSVSGEVELVVEAI